MTVRNHRIRFMTNNFIKNLESSRYSYSSQISTFPFTNSQNEIRGKVFKFSGYFLIDTTNLNIYINDGSNKTVALTASTTAYTTPALLAAHIQTQLNASSANWTCTYSTSTYKFTIGNSGSVTLRLSQTTNAAWDTLGFTTSTDLVGTSFPADQQRNHTSESVLWDLGSSGSSMTFFACINPLGSIFPISDIATVKLQANNIDLWTAPPIDITLTRFPGGLFLFMDDLSDTKYRYWKFSFIDKLNPNGPESFALSHFYLGDYITFSNRDIGFGYNKNIVDQSIVSSSENGTLYTDSKTKYTQFGNLGLDILKRENKDALEKILYKIGKGTNFYVSLDPINMYTDTLPELTRFVTFSEMPQFNFVMRDMFTCSLKIKEVV